MAELIGGWVPMDKKDVDEEIDTESTIEIDEEQPTTKKKSSKK